jgi:ABC-type phosphate/phosphonate transport system ATPase subunit
MHSLEEPRQHFDKRIRLYAGKVLFELQVSKIMKCNVDTVRTQELLRHTMRTGMRSETMHFIMRVS